jgi:hypothetical protein|tara:strand:- start:1699 stop:1842 length:144 start_codon:yes stop_codon:yes gene_type:complete
MTIKKLENGKNVKIVLRTDYKLTPQSANTKPYANTAQSTPIKLRVGM